ncbi:FcoT family thioesterase [Engelhardtia mirabilis]|uniref:(2E)-enoyl-[ACP] glycyltransferase n=1 Tax=Engelhardtia mirabilis TaxID=2528011 RepID=A0A518BER7_9BACT|nr:FcoT-like thioesterase domain protein [Planctomycetes bacterium Pla133]QDU99778.1 FcoT-like thioesterase domain protein [Planctomycetes bacterium Pla86]
MSAGPRSIGVTDELLARVLTPYRDNCRYLKSAVVELPGHARAGDPQAVIYGRLAIGESCYIQDTGHFNSVEFNLCYNQLVYALMAQVVVGGLLPAFESWTLDEYLARQLPDVLIHDFSSKFHRPMATGDFEGTVEIVDAVQRSRFLLVHTRCSFRDDAGGHSHGDVSLAIVDRAAGTASRERRAAAAPDVSHS